MKIYILWIKEFYDEPRYIEGLFTSEEKAIKYRDDMIKFHNGLYKINDFEIECYNTNINIFKEMEN